MFRFVSFRCQRCCPCKHEQNGVRREWSDGEGGEGRVQGQVASFYPQRAAGRAETVTKRRTGTGCAGRACASGTCAARCPCHMESAVPHLVGFASGVDGGAAGRGEVREVLRAEGGDGGGVKRPQDVFGESCTAT